MITRDNVLNFFDKIKQFGLFIPLSNLVLTYGRKFPSLILRKLATRRNKLIQKKLFRLVGDCITDKLSTNCHYIPNAPIWFYWMQGKDNLPPIPKLCLNSLRKHANGHPVIFLDADNINQYINIPSNIVKAYRAGQLKQAHYADIIRILLLAQHGGLWMDATLLITRDLPESIFQMPFYSIKTKEYGYFVSHCRWSVFCLAGWKHNILFEKLSECFTCYFNKTDVMIDYFMFDQLIDMLYNEHIEIRNMIDKVPYSNPNVHRMNRLLLDNFDKGIYKQITEKTYLFKLNWKIYTNEQLAKNPNNFFNTLLRHSNES